MTAVPYFGAGGIALTYTALFSSRQRQGEPNFSPTGGYENGYLNTGAKLYMFADDSSEFQLPAANSDHWIMEVAATSQWTPASPDTVNYPVLVAYRNANGDSATADGIFFGSGPAGALGPNDWRQAVEAPGVPIYSAQTPAVTYARDGYYYMLTVLTSWQAALSPDPREKAGGFRLYRTKELVSWQRVHPEWLERRMPVGIEGLDSVTWRMPRLITAPHQVNGVEVYDGFYIGYSRADSTTWLGDDSSVFGAPMFMTSVGRIEETGTVPGFATGPVSATGAAESLNYFAFTPSRDASATVVQTARGAPAMAAADSRIRMSFVVGSRSPSKRMWQDASSYSWANIWEDPKTQCAWVEPGEVLLAPEIHGSDWPVRDHDDFIFMGQNVNYSGPGASALTGEELWSMSDCVGGL